MPHHDLPNDLEPNTYTRRRGDNIEGAREGRVVYRATVVVTRGFGGLEELVTPGGYSWLCGRPGVCAALYCFCERDTLDFYLNLHNL